MTSKQAKKSTKVRLKKDDDVVILAGKDKGKQGKVLNVLKKDNKVVVEGINMVKKHVRPNPQLNQQGGIVSLEKPIHASSVAIYNPQTKRADKIGYELLKDGSKVRVYKSNREHIDGK